LYDEKEAGTGVVCACNECWLVWPWGWRLQVAVGRMPRAIFQQDPDMLHRFCPILFGRAETYAEAYLWQRRTQLSQPNLFCGRLAFILIP